MIPSRYQLLDAFTPGKPLKARDLEMAQTVVLHTLTGLEDGGADVLQRAQVVRGVWHPFLLALVDCVKLDEQTVLLVSEFVPARSLRSICGGQPIHVRRATEILAEIADGLAELHSRGFGHQAVSIDSVLVTEKGRAKLDLVSAVGEVGAGGPGGAGGSSGRGASGGTGGAGGAGSAGGSDPFEDDVRSLVALLKEITAQPIVGLRRFTSAPLLAAHLRTQLAR